MKHYIHLLLAGLLVGSGGCHHDDPAPAPTVQGTWRYEATTTTPLPVGSGRSTTQVNPVSVSHLITFGTLSQGTAYESYGGIPSAKVPYGYRSGTFYIDNTTYQVLRLSQQVLVLRSQGLLGPLPVQLTDSLTRVL